MDICKNLVRDGKKAYELEYFHCSVESCTCCITHNSDRNRKIFANYLSDGLHFKNEIISYEKQVFIA